MREKYLEQYYEYRNYTPGPGSMHDSKMNIHQVLNFINHVHEKNCDKYVLHNYFDFFLMFPSRLLTFLLTMQIHRGRAASTWGHRFRS